MENIKILKQLLNGNHLEPKELEKAKRLNKQLKEEINRRLKSQILKY